MTGILLQAFKKNCPDHKLWVCDFGMTRYECNILAKMGVLLQKPTFIKDNLHPWIYKASVYHYITQIYADVVVWIDSDSFPVGSYALEVEKIVSKWGIGQDKIAICQDWVNKTWEFGSSSENISYFQMQPQCPYYGAGNWILYSKNVLEHYASEIEAVPKTGYWEQDLFNYLLNKNSVIIQQLPNEIWQVAHDGLNDIEIDSDNKVTLNNNEVLIIHITGVYNNRNISVGPLQGTIRTVDNTKLTDLQLQLITEWVDSNSINIV